MARFTSHQVSTYCTQSSPSIGRRLARIGAWLRRALEVSRQRRALYRLDDTALRDLGLSRADAWREADRPFWEQPVAEAKRRSC